jgi:hypothetical protein
VVENYPCRDGDGNKSSSTSVAGMGIFFSSYGDGDGDKELSIMIQHRRPSVRDSRPDVAPQERALSLTKTKKQIPNPSYAYPPSTQCSVATHPSAPFPHRALIGLSHRALPPSPGHATCPCSLRRSLPRRPFVAYSHRARR